jgi:hypothetical protein
MALHADRCTHWLSDWAASGREVGEKVDCAKVLAEAKRCVEVARLVTDAGIRQELETLARDLYAGAERALDKRRR